MSAVAQPPPAPRHRLLTPALLTVATILAFFASVAVWTNRQALNTDEWTKTSGNLLADHAVQDALSVYLVNQLFEAVNVPERLERALPGQLKGLSGPVSAGLRQLAGQEVPALLATAQVQELWRRANRNAHKQLIAILGGGGKTVSTSNGVVVLDIHRLVTELGAQLGIGSQVAAARAKLAEPGGAAARAGAEQKLGVKLPPSSGRITILRASQLKTAQNIAKAIKGLAILLPLLAIAMYGLAIWLAESRRRLMMRTVGWCLVGVGLTLLVARRVAGQQIVDGLVAVPANKPAGEAVWSIGTSLLYNIAVATLLYGLVLVGAAWLGGKTRVASALRHAGAPWMREHATGSYAVAGALLVLVVLWGPTEATRKWGPVLGFAVLAALGVAALRRQTAAEFPNAAPGEAVAVLRAALPFGSGRAGGSAERPAPPDPPATAPAPQDPPATAPESRDPPATAPASDAPPADEPAASPADGAPAAPG